MHFFSRRNASLALSLAAVGVLAACGDDVTVPVEPPPPVVISVTPQNVTLNPGGSATLAVQITGGNPTPTLASCTSANAAVATAAVSGNSCTVTAVASGSTTITAATSSGQSASANVQVAQLPPALGNLTVSPSTAGLSVGETVTLVPNANPGEGVATTFTYSSSSSAIATVNASGVVTAVAPGVATVTVTANGSGSGFAPSTRTFGVTIEVSEAPPAISEVGLNVSALALRVGRTGEITTSVTQPDGATAATVTYESSNTAVATVSSGASIEGVDAATLSSNATVTAVAPGNATITVTATAPATSTLSAVTVTRLVNITVDEAPPAITALSVDPVQVELARGLTQELAVDVDQPEGATAASVTYVSSEPSVASVNTSGVITAVAPGTATITVTADAPATTVLAATTLTELVTVTVVEAPPAITSLSVDPATLNIAVGRQRQVNADVDQPAGAPAASVTYESTDVSVITVSGTGASATVTAVAPGTATITVTATAPASATLSGVTLTESISVIVSDVANVTIQALRQGPIVTSYDNTALQEGLITANNPQVDEPVDINNVKDQIQIVTNLQANGQRVDSLVIYVHEGGDDALTCGGNLDDCSAARQNFTNGDASQASVIELPINTADFTLDWSEGIARVKYNNGTKIIAAKLWTSDAAGQNPAFIQGADNNRLTVNFNNVDSWAGQYVYPNRVAQGGAGSNNNLNWYGGPAAEGQGTWAIAPVFYTPNRSVRTVQTRPVVLGDNGAGVINNMGGAGAANICAVRTFTNTSPFPWRSQYGYAGVTGNNVNCQGFEHPVTVNGLLDARNYVTLFNAIDNSNNPAPFVRRLNGYRTNLQRGITQPVPNRLDYAVPTVTVNVNPQISGAEAQWANGAYNFVAATGEADAGVGLPTPLGQTYSWVGCGTGNGSATPVTFDGLVKPAGTPGEIPECSNDFLGGTQNNGPYRVTATQADVLGNTGTGTSPRFGVDKTNPEVSLNDVGTLTGGLAGAALPQAVSTAADSVFDNATNTFGAVNALSAHFGVRYRDERAGFAQNNHGTRTLTRWSVPAVPVLANTSTVTVGNAIAPQSAITLSFAENPVEVFDPTYRRDSVCVTGGDIAGACPNGALPGYYEYVFDVRDRAGNNTVVKRSAAVDVNSANVTGVSIPAVLTGGASTSFLPTGTDDLEGLDADMFLNFPTMALAGDAAADPTVVANVNGRLRFRRSWFTDWHARFAGANRNVGLMSDGLLSSPFGPGAALSNAGITMPIPFVQRIEVVSIEDVAAGTALNGPHGRPNLTGIRADLQAIANHATWNAPVAFKPNQLGMYVSDIRATSPVVFPNLGLSNNNPGTDAAYLETLFDGNIVQPATNPVDYWGSRDVDPTTAGTQYLWFWYGFSFAGTTVEFRAETGTNVVNSPFARVDFYRWNADANVNAQQAPGADPAAIQGQWVYLGSINANAPTNPIIQDQGVTRFWRFRFTYAGTTVNNGPNNIEGALNTGDILRAVGVDANGNGISTLNYTLP